MRSLHIRWQRLVDASGCTCERCGATEVAVDEAADLLRAALGVLGIEVAVDKRTIDAAAFQADPLASNRVWVGGEPLEAWFGGVVGESACCGACGDAGCRTITVDGTRHEAVPSALIVRAGLLAGQKLLAGQMPSADVPAPGAEPAGGCCAPAGSDTPSRCC